MNLFPIPLKGSFLAVKTLLLAGLMGGATLWSGPALEFSDEQSQTWENPPVHRTMTQNARDFVFDRLAQLRCAARMEEDPSESERLRSLCQPWERLQTPLALLDDDRDDEMMCHVAADVADVVNEILIVMAQPQESDPIERGEQEATIAFWQAFQEELSAREFSAPHRSQNEVSQGYSLCIVPPRRNVVLQL